MDRQSFEFIFDEDRIVDTQTIHNSMEGHTVTKEGNGNKSRG